MRKSTNTVRRAVEIYKNQGLGELSRRSFKMLNHPSFRHLKYYLQYSNAAAPMQKLIYINPNDIDYFVVPRFQKVLHNRGYHIRNGEWDTRILNRYIIFNADFDDSIERRGIVSFDNFGLYQSMKDRFLNGYDWEETVYYQWEKRMCEKGHRNSSISSIRSKCNRIDQLYHSMQNDGYLSQKELTNSISNPERHEVMIDIGRDGQLFLDDGRHRLCIAKLLDIDTIPVKILVRHKGWQEIRSRAINRGINAISDGYKTHPDLLDLSKDIM